MRKSLRKRVLYHILALAMILTFTVESLPIMAVATNDDPLLDADQETSSSANFISESGIDYTQQDIIVNGSVDGFSINLTKETITIPAHFSVSAYSVDGSKWKKMKSSVFSDSKFPKLLNKGLRLKLTDNYDSKRKKPASDATIVTFAKIAARPAPQKLIPNYAIEADLSGVTPGAWVLTAKGNATKAVKSGIEVAPADGKSISEYGYGVFFEEGGIPVQPLTGVKISKNTYYYRTAPVEKDSSYIAASKPAKVSVTSELKAKKYKVDYKTETIELKNGDIIFAGDFDEIGTNPYTDIKGNTAKLLADETLYLSGQTGAIVSITGYLSTSPKTVVIRHSATAKKAATAPQIYTLAPRSVIEEEIVLGRSGKITLPKEYEVNNGEKWGKLSKAKVTASKSQKLRKRPTAKANGNVDTGYAASFGGVDIAYGVYDADKNKRGGIKATIYPEERCVHSISDVVFADDAVWVEISSGANVVLEVSVLQDISETSDDWDSGKLLARGQITLEEPYAFDVVSVPISAFSEDYFIIGARLLDRNGLDLCDPFYLSKYTRGYEKYLALTTADFAPESVIDFDGDQNKNFMATSDGVRKITAGENGKNILVSADNGTYILQSADDGLLTAKAGDKFVVIDDQSMHLIDIKKITINGDTVTISAADDTIFTDYFDYVRIDVMNYVDVSQIDMTNSDSGVELVTNVNKLQKAFEGSNTAASASDITPILSMTSDDLKPSYFATDEPMSLSSGIVPMSALEISNFGFNINTEPVKGTFWITQCAITTNIEYADSLIPAYVKVSVNFDWKLNAKVTITIKKEDNKRIQLCDPIGDACYAYTGGLVAIKFPLDLYLSWDIDADIDFTVKGTTELGFQYNNGNVSPIIKKEISTDLNRLDGNFCISICVGESLGIGVLWDMLTAYVYLGVGPEINGKGYSFKTNYSPATTKHACDNCLEGNVDLISKAGFEVVFKAPKTGIGVVDFVTGAITKTYLVKQSVGNMPRIKIAEYYYSLVNDPESVHGGKKVFNMGWYGSGVGNCPNKVFLTTVNPQQGSKTMLNAKATVFPKTSLNTKFNEPSGAYSLYLYPLSYTATAAAPGVAFADVEFFVVNQTQTVVLSAKLYENQETLSIVDPGAKTYGDASFNLSTSGGSGKGDVNYSLESGGDVVSLSGDTVTILNAGEFSVKATKDGDNEYLPVESAPITVTVSKRDISKALIGINGTTTYDGTPKTPTPTVTDENLINQIDYTVSYSNNINAGSATIAITATSDGNYIGTKKDTFTIDKATLTVLADNHSIIAGTEKPALTYILSGFVAGETSNVVSGTPSLSCNYIPSSGSGDYTITVSQGSLASANYNFAFMNGVLSVGKSAQSALMITSPGTKSYGDAAFSLSVSGGSGTGGVIYQLISGDAVTVTSAGSVTIKTVGNATIRATKAGDNIYAPTTTDITITISKRNLSSASAGVSGTLTYNGNSQTPVPTVSDSVAITASDYTYSAGSYSNNKNAGTATLTITATANGNYTGSMIVNFTIGKRQFSVVSIDTVSSCNYDGLAKMPTPSISDGGIIASSDYAISWSNNMNAGTATITITPTAGGNYTGAARTVNFTINKATGGAINSSSMTLESVGNKFFTVSPVTTTTGQTVQYAISTSSNATIAETSWTTNRTFSSLENSTYYIYTRTQSNTNYNTGAIRVYIIYNTGWTAVITETVPNDAAGSITYVANLVDGSTQLLHSWSASGTGTFTVSATTFFPPWFIQSLTVSWNAPSGIDRNLEINPIQLEMKRYGITAFSKNLGRFYQTHSNFFGGATKTQTFNIW